MTVRSRHELTRGHRALLALCAVAFIAAPVLAGAFNTQAQAPGDVGGDNPAARVVFEVAAVRANSDAGRCGTGWPIGAGDVRNTGIRRTAAVWWPDDRPREGIVGVR
jgi:hypothetical protein